MLTLAQAASKPKDPYVCVCLCVRDSEGVCVCVYPSVHTLQPKAPFFAFQMRTKCSLCDALPQFMKNRLPFIEFI